MPDAAYLGVALRHFISADSRAVRPSIPESSKTFSEFSIRWNGTPLFIFLSLSLSIFCLCPSSVFFLCWEERDILKGALAFNAEIRNTYLEGADALPPDISFRTNFTPKKYQCEISIVNLFVLFLDLLLMEFDLS